MGNKGVYTAVRECGGGNVIVYLLISFKINAILKQLIYFSLIIVNIVHARVIIKRKIMISSHHHSIPQTVGYPPLQQ